MKKIFFSLQSIVVVIVGVSAFASGIFFALPEYRRDSARVDFSHVSVAAEIVDTPETMARGLSGRRFLPARGGMLFVLEKPDYLDIWMKDMLFPIDVLWIANGKVVDMRESVPPPIAGAPLSSLPVYHPVAPVDFVLEVKGGFSRENNVRIGDRVSIELAGRKLAFAQTDDEGNTRLVAQDALSFPAGTEYTIDTLRAISLRGSDFNVGDVIESNSVYSKYAITYRSGDLTISGVMNVPKSTNPHNKFPVLILNHGLIPPAIYTTGRGSKREQDFFSRHGYITIHPDYRGHASSSPNTALHHDFYVGYSEDVMNLLDAIERDPPAFLDTSRIGLWGHSMGGGIAARIMTLRPEVRAYVLFAPISADAEDNFFELTPEEVNWLHDTYGPAGNPIYQKISPITYFNDVSAPVQIHHGAADIAVPILFSEKIYSALKQYGKKVEYFMYPGEKHEFINDWPLAANRALQFFDRYVKKN